MPRKRMRKPSALSAPAAVQPPQQTAQSQQVTQAAGGAQQVQLVDSSDPIIKQVQDELRSRLPPAMRIPVMRIELAGKKVMYDPQTHGLMLKVIQQNTDPAEAAGMGVTQLLTILYNESKGRMPLPAIPPAAILLVCDALDFMEKQGIVKVTPDIMDRATQTVIAYLMQKMGLTPNKIQNVLSQQGAVQQQQQPQPPQGGLVSGAMQPPQGA